MKKDITYLPTRNWTNKYIIYREIYISCGISNRRKTGDIFSNKRSFSNGVENQLDVKHVYLKYELKR